MEKIKLRVAVSTLTPGGSCMVWEQMKSFPIGEAGSYIYRMSRIYGYNFQYWVWE